MTRPKRVFIIIPIIAAALLNGCGGGQTKPDDPNSQHQQHRCGPGQRCADLIGDDPPPSPNSSPPVVVVHD